MVWQELVFFVGGFALALVLVPMLRAPEKPPLASSVPTWLILSSYAVAFITLGQYVSAVGVGATAVLWGALAYQRFAQR